MTSKKLVSLLSLLFLFNFAYSRFEFDASLWHISGAKTSFNEQVSENNTIDFSSISTSKPVFELTNDANKYLFELKYTFDDYLYRLTLGYQYAGAGKANPKKVTWNESYNNLKSLFTTDDINEEKIEYSNLYASYRILPFNSDSSSNNNIQTRGVDAIVSWTSYSEKFAIENNNKSVDFSTTCKSIGLGIGGETGILDDLLYIRGRVVYLPFFNFPGSGFDTELKIIYLFNDYLNVYAGYKSFNLDVSAKEAINFAGIDGYSSSTTTFKGLKVNTSGLVLGFQLKF